MSKPSRFLIFLSKRRALLIVIVAALLIELLSAVQYVFTHRLLEDELERRAELELTLKAIITKGLIQDSERTVKSHIKEVKSNLSNPDSLAGIVAWTLKHAPHLEGCGIAFSPGYYGGRHELFEPYALRTDSGILSLELAGEEFDYTRYGFYNDIRKRKENSWVGPYYDHYLHEQIVSYAVPIYDESGDTVAVYGIDIHTGDLGDTLNYRHLYPSSFVFLLTEHGQLLAGPKDPEQQQRVEQMTALMGDSTVEKRWNQRGTMRIISHYDREADDNLTLFFANMRGQPHWQVAVVCYDDEVYAPLIWLRLRLLLFSLLAFGILLFLISAFARSEQKLRQRTMEQNRIAGELRIAADIQQALLPAEEPSLLGRTDVSVEGRLIPAKAVGGDLYNAFVRDGKLFFCIGDVSGKGVPAALIMAIVQALFRTIATREDNPAHIMRHLNESACQGNTKNFFVTLFIGVLDLPTGHFRYCNAGHEVPLVIDHSPLTIDLSSPLSIDHSQQGTAAGECSMFNVQCSMEKGQCSMLDCLPNLPIGILDDFDYQMQSMTMKPGSALFLYTDGLTEARNEENKLLGREAVLQMVSKFNTSEPKELVAKAIQAWHAFVGSTEQSDDLTLLAVRYTPMHAQELFSEALTLGNDVQEVEALGAFVKGIAAKLSLERSLASKLRLAVEEAVVNVMEYAYPKGTTGQVDIRATSDGQRLRFVITDNGIPFNPTEVSQADTTLSAEERPVGGLGILLVRQLMDSINYERIGTQNVLTLQKTLPKTVNPTK